MKLKSKLCLAALTALTALSAGFAVPVLAQVGGSGYPTTSTESAAPSNSAATADFNKLDTNRDGYISKQEARKDKALNKAFDSLDTNKDGKLDATEFSAYSGASGGSTSSPTK